MAMPARAPDMPARQSARRGERLELKGLRRDFSGFAALKGLDLTIEPGEFVALLGPSGCGKTTALNCIAGLTPLTAGSISLGPLRIDQLPPERRGFGMVFQSYALFPHMTARKNVGFGLAMQNVARREAAQRVDEALTLVRLAAQADKLPGQMSGGQQQRVAIARAVVIRPPVVLMDEPLSNLDAKLRLEMRGEIRRIHEAIGSTTIYVTHDQDEALSMADRIVVMRDGLIRQTGSPTDLYERPAHVDVAEFMGFRTQLPGRVVTSDGTRATIEACSSTLQVLQRGPLAEGQAVVLMMRPEDLVAGPVGIPVTVRIAEYRGRAFFGAAETADGTELFFRSDKPTGAGDRITVAARPEQILLYPAAAA
nr:ABC transporter ATP-binding protein [Lichenihabitans psoromatis]